MSLPIYQRVAVTDAGDVIPGAEYTVINENTGVAAPIYSDRTGATLLSAPYFADSVGTIQFFIAQGTTFRVAASGGVGTYTDRYVYGVAEAVLVQADGNVGIGTSSPSDKINIVGGGASIEGSASGFTGGEVRLGTSTADTQSAISTMATGTPQMYFDHRGTAAGQFIWRSSSAERMRISSAGDLLVNCTANGNLSAAHEIIGNSSSAGTAGVVIANMTGTASCPALNIANADSSTDSSNRFMQFYSGYNGTFASAMGGIVGNGANNVQFAAISDIREKQNITSLSGSLSKINRLNPVEFDWIESGEHCKGGFVAQEVEEIFPEYVIQNVSNGDDEERKGITGGMTAGFVSHLVKAIQEQQTLIEALTARIETLEAK